MTRDRALAIGVIAAGALARVAVAGSLGLLADEAYYRCWAMHPALGYFDQPPMIAWLLALVPSTHPLATRLPAIACAVIAPMALLPWARHPIRWAAAWLSPVLFGLTLVTTPDAPLLCGWSLALAGALLGGPGWILAGVGGGIAFLSKYTGLAVVPLAIAAVGPIEWRTRWPWIGLAAMLAVIAPNVWWNAEHGWISVVFQLHEGLINPNAPGLLGPVGFILGQIAAVTPILAIAAGWAVVRARPDLGDRTTRILISTSIPVVALFLIASAFAPSEAHWPAPAWIGALLLVANAPPRLQRITDVGLWTAVIGSAVVVAHALHPLVPLAEDPRDRFAEGALLVDGVRAWAVPAASEPDQTPAIVLGERYQEVAFLRAAGLPAFREPSCGRADEFTRADAIPAFTTAYFVRPWRSGPLTCIGDDLEVVGGPWDIDGRDATGHRVGRWQVFEVAPGAP